MADVMSQQGLSAPHSRQDIISALLNEYATGFGRGDACNSVYSPIQELKSLPPTPHDIPRKQLPPGVQAMHAPFQLRDDQDAPLSPTSPLKDSPPRKRILSRSLSRGSKPPSLNLTVSNGSTATIPPTPALPPRKQSVPDKDLPPAPPTKSEGRQSLRQGDMGSKMSKTREAAKRDSLLSQGEPAQVSPPIVKRKAVPEAVKKFKSLAELGNGPRGRKGAPTSRTSAQRDESVDSQRSNATARNTSVDSKRDMSTSSESRRNEQPRNMQAELPPTPDEEKDEAKPPAPPKKVFTGLPSNPRGKALASPLHMRGKSSTGFNVLKAMRPAPPPPNVPDVRSMTPEMTPSPPSLKPGAANNDFMISPLSPLPAPSDQRQEKPVTVTAAPAAPASKSPTAEPRVPLSRPSLQTPEPSPATQSTSAGLYPKSSDLEDCPLSPEPGPSVPSSPVKSVPTVQNAAVAPVHSLPSPSVEISPSSPSKAPAVQAPKALPTPPLQQPQQQTISPTFPSPPVQQAQQPQPLPKNPKHHPLLP
ncbi:hypothetical protein A1F94_010875 [Pyrenophora tritici-repentis]|nr:hypothetical protein A1F94_010875 [Pyrenophora tritici-repentis]